MHLFTNADADAERKGDTKTCEQQTAHIVRRFRNLVLGSSYLLSILYSTDTDADAGQV